jgi:branched-chain amino acid aminotransferase
VTLRGGRFSGPGSAAKSLPYLASILALQEARSRGAEEAIFVAPDGMIREAATANVFVLDDRGALVTPSDGPQVLGGITRSHIIDLACTLGLSCAIRPVELASLATAREVFLTSSVREVMSVVRVDGSAIGAGVPGDVARTLHIALRVRAGAAGSNPWE